MRRMTWLVACWCGVLSAALATGQEMTTLGKTLGRADGVDARSGTAYTRLYLVSEGAGAFDTARPMLTVDCTRRQDGKYGFGMALHYNGTTDTGFHAIRSLHAGQPHFEHTDDQREVTLEFLGYTRVKPLKRQFLLVSEPAGALVYNPPGLHSYNLEDASYPFQYLRALPTFRTTYSGWTVTFETEPLLAQISKEPLCAASHL